MNLFQDADGNNFIGTCYQDLWTAAVNSVASMIEVTTMFARSSLGRDTGRNRNKKVYSQVTTTKSIKIDESIIPKKQIKLTT
jgi:hypothetical protein